MRLKSPFMSVKQEVIELTDKKTNKKIFLLKSNNTEDDKWIKITEDEYNKIFKR